MGVQTAPAVKAVPEGAAGGIAQRISVAEKKDVINPEKEAFIKGGVYNRLTND